MKRSLFRIFEHPWIVASVLIVISAFFLWKMVTNSRMETDLDEYMPQQHPAFVYSNQAEEWFDIKDGIIIAVEHPDSIYNPTTLVKIKDLTKELQQFEEVDKSDVTSLYTADNIIGTDIGLDVKAFYKKVPESEDKLAALRKAVADNEMVSGRLVSGDERVALVVAEIGDDVFTMEFYHRILDLAESYEGPETLHVAGRPIVEGTLAYLGPRDMQRLAPIVFIIIIAVLLLLLRSVKSTLLTLSVVLLSIVWAFGLMALLNVPIYSVSTMIPVMLTAIGVAYGIHLFSHLELYLRENPDATRPDAVADMLHHMWKPVLMTAVTTMVGFSSLVTSQVYPVKYFGLFTAFGVGSALLLSLMLIPAGIGIFGLPRTGRRKKTVEKSGEGHGLALLFSRKIVRSKYLVILVTVGVVGASVFGIGKVWINSSFLDNFEKDSDIVSTDRFINERFGGTSTLNVVLEGPEENIIKDPGVLRAMDSLQEDVETLAMVGDSFGLTDFLKRMNKVMHADDPAYDTIPESRELVAQYLLLYEMSGDPANLWKVVDYEYRKGNLTFQLKSDDSVTIKEAIDVIEEYQPLFEEMGVRINYAGSGYKGLVFSELILNGQISSLLLALAIVVIFISVMFKNILVGLIGALPITITALVNFGFMGLAGIPLSTTTALVSSIAIGIGVDYAIHFIERYREYARATGNKRKTMALTMRHTGRAILFNAAVVIAGFLVLLTSVFPPNRSLGGLVSLNMFTSLAGTVTVMFLILYLTNMYFIKKKNHNSGGRQ